MIERQLELGLKSPKQCKSVSLRHGRRHRRRYEWFERIRQLVDDAPEPEMAKEVRVAKS